MWPPQWSGVGYSNLGLFEVETTVVDTACGILAAHIDSCGQKTLARTKTYVPMFGGLASQCTFSVHWRDATPLQGGVLGGGGGAGEEGEGGREWGVGGGMEGGGGRGGGAGGVYFL